MPPVNDNFADRITLTGDSGTWSGSSDGATHEADEPSPFAGTGGASIWFEWTPGFTGRAQIDTIGSTYTGTADRLDTVVDIFTGSTLLSLSLVGGNDDVPGGAYGYNSRARVDVVAGTTYVIRVDGYGGDTGDVILHWLQYVPPPPPTVTGFTPASANPGDTVTVTGTNFIDLDRVGVRFKFPYSGNEFLNVSFTIDSPTQLHFVVPALAFGDVTGSLIITGGEPDYVDVVTSLGLIIPGTFGIVSVLPPSGPAGTEVTVTGTQLVTSGIDTLRLVASFGGTDSIPFTIDSETQLRFTVPDGASEGAYRVEIRHFADSNPDIDSSAAQVFTVVPTPPPPPPPPITESSPVAGPPVRSANVTWVPAGTASYDVPTPPGAVVGDVLIAFTRGDTSGTRPTDFGSWDGFLHGPPFVPGRVFWHVLTADDLPTIPWTISTAHPNQAVQAIVQVVVAGYVADTDFRGDSHGLIEGLTSWSWADPGSLSPTDPTITTLPAMRLCIAVGDCDTDPTVAFSAGGGLTTVLAENYHNSDGIAAAAIVAFEHITTVGPVGSRPGASTARIGSDYGTGSPTERGWQWNMVFQPGDFYAPPPADEPGWRLTTLRQFSNDDAPGGIRGWLAPSTDGRYLYVAPAGGSTVWRIDLGSYSVDQSWTPPVGATALATDPAGNLYFVNGTDSIGKIDPASGAVTSWVTIAGHALNWLTAGRDGFLYVQVDNRRVFRVSYSGVATEVLELYDRFFPVYGRLAVLADGTIWLDMPAGSDGHNTKLRRFVPTTAVGLTANDSTFDPGAADSPPDFQVGRWWASKVTYQLDRVTSPSPVSGTGVMRLSVVDGSDIVTSPLFGDGDNLDTYEVAAGDDVHMSIFVRADPANAHAGTYKMYAGFDVYGQGVGPPLAGFDSWPPSPVSESSWTEVVVDGTMPADARFVQMFCRLSAGDSGPLATGDVFYFSFATANLRQRGKVTDFAIQTIEGGSGSVDQAQGGLFADDAGHLIVPMVDTAAAGKLSWFLRIAPDGTATRIAGTWGYGGTPPPALTETNVADGPLGVSLAADCQFACGITPDGKRLYFVDSDRVLRILDRGVGQATAAGSRTRLWKDRG